MCVVHGVQCIFYFILQNQTKVRLLDFVQLDALQARDIVKVIADYSELHEVPQEFLVMLTSDGASVMTGRNGGVVALLRVMRLLFFEFFLTKNRKVETTFFALKSMQQNYSILFC